jgi:hypothetical protein
MNIFRDKRPRTEIHQTGISKKEHKKSLPLLESLSLVHVSKTFTQ